jgi:hypothetical protein
LATVLRMPYVKRIICLANSFKYPRGRCIAGREVVGERNYGGWIRPVSSRPTQELQLSECRYKGSGSLKLLDIIDVPLLKPVPHAHQTENYEIEPAPSWNKVGELPWDDLDALCELPESLWINSDHTNAGYYDCMSPQEAATQPNSLVLIKKEHFVVEVGSSTWNGKTTKKYRGKFEYKGKDYSLSLTDPIARTAFASKPDGDYPVDDAYLCISLTETYKDDGRCHKLVAAVITSRPL